MLIGLLLNSTNCKTPRITALTVKLHVKLHVTSVVTTNNIQTLCCTLLAFLGSLLGKMPSHKKSCVPFCWGLKEKKKSYYNKFKFTFLINNKISVTNSWVKNDREVLNIVDGHRMTLNRQSGAIAKETTTIQYEDNYFQQTLRSISITVEGLRKIYLEYWVQFWLCMFIKEKYEECKSYPVSED